MRRACLAMGIMIIVGATVPARAATLFGLVDTGELYSSANDGVTWTPLSTLPVRDAVALAARLTSTDLFLASATGSIYRSTDGGVEWNAVGAVPAHDAVDLAIRPDGALLILTLTGSVYRSTDLGVSFTALAALPASNFTSLAINIPAAKVYALTRTGEVYESVDGGTAWVPKGVMPVSNAQRLEGVQSTLYALTESGDTFRSSDAASTWIPVGTLSQVGMRGLTRNGAMIAAATREGHVATSPDGSLWTWQGSINQLSLTALASNEPATTGVEPTTGGILSIGLPYPNPSSGAISLALRLDRGARVEVELHDLLGRRVATRPVEFYGPGDHVLSWTPHVPGAGLYFVTVRTESGITGSQRWVVLR